MYQQRNIFIWFLLVLFAILLIVAGIQGSAGRMLAVALVPGEIDVNENLPSDSTPWAPFSELPGGVITIPPWIIGGTPSKTVPPSSASPPGKNPKSPPTRKGGGAIPYYPEAANPEAMSMTAF